MFHNTSFHNASVKQKKTKTTAMILQEYCGRLTDYLICIWILIVTVILPFYFEQGYRYIATDKNMFFRQSAINMGKALAPVLAVYLILSVIVYIQKKGELFQRKMSGKGFAGFWKEFIRDGKGMIRRKFTLVDLFAGVYGLALVISYLCSDYQEQALWGAKGWYMGFYPQLMLLCIYFLISKLWTPRKVYFYLILAVSAAVFGLGYLNRFSIYPIKMEMSSPGFISTIGNINWYCGYAVTVFFAGAALFWQKGGTKTWQNILLALYVWLGFAALVTQGSASGIMTLGAVMLLLFVLSAGEGERMSRFWLTAFLLGCACLFTEIFMAAAPERMNFPDEIMNLLITGAAPIIMTIVSFTVWMRMRTCTGNRTLRSAGTAAPGNKTAAREPVFWRRQKSFPGMAAVIMTIVSVFAVAFIALITVNTLHPGSLGKLSEYDIFTFSDTWGSRRGATWKAGFGCFSEQNLLHKLVGVGPDAMEAFLYPDGSRELTETLQKVFGYNYLTNAHNEWLTVLVNTGILGLAGFGGMTVSAIRSFAKKIGENPIAGACGISIIAYTVNNIFSFQQIMNVTLLYVIMGIGMAFLRKEP